MMATQRALDAVTADLALDDPYERVGASERDRVAGIWQFSCAGSTVRLEKRFQETSRAGLTADLIIGYILHEGNLYSYQVSVGFDQSRPTARMERRDIPYPTPRMVVEYQGVEYVDLIREYGSTVKLVQSGSRAVVEGMREGRPIKLTFDKKDDMWLLSDASIPLEAPNGESRYYINLVVSEWRTGASGEHLPQAARRWFGDEENRNQDKGRSYLASNWKEPDEPVVPASRIREGALVIDESDSYFRFAADGSLIPVSSPRPDVISPWAIVYLLSGAGLVMSLGFFLAKYIRSKSMRRP